MSKKKITIIDYGMGNIASLKNAFTYLGAEVVVTDDPEKIKNSNYVILPGVGSFKRAMEQIKRRNIDDAIIETAKKGNYIFGICLGMQLMGASSTEDSYTKGIGLIDNEEIRFSTNDTKGNKIPHVGFNSVNFEKKNSLFKGLKDGSDFYFVHSFYMSPKNLKCQISTSYYGINFLSSFHKDNICATQFHPEKSQGNGLQLIKNFLNF